MCGSRSVIACKARSRGFALDDYLIGKSRLRSIPRPLRDQNACDHVTCIPITKVRLPIGAVHWRNFNFKRAQHAPETVAQRAIACATGGSAEWLGRLNCGACHMGSPAQATCSRASRIHAASNSCPTSSHLVRRCLTRSAGSSSVIFGPRVAKTTKSLDSSSGFTH